MSKTKTDRRARLRGVSHLDQILCSIIEYDFYSLVPLFELDKVH